MNIRLIQTLFMPPPPPPSFNVRTNGVWPYSQTLLYRHPLNTDYPFIRTLFLNGPTPPSFNVRTNGVWPHNQTLLYTHPLNTDTSLIGRPRSYGHFLLTAPSVSLLTGFDCRGDFMKFSTFVAKRYLWNTVKSRLLVNADTEVVIETVLSGCL